jgi:superfamily II DNA or RNA helicase
MTTIVTIAHNAIHAKLMDATREVKLEVQQILSYEVAGAEHTTRFQTTDWDGRSSFLGFISGVFPAGFVHLVTAHLTRRGYRVNVVKKPLPPALGPAMPVVDTFGEDPRYDYQRDVCERLVKHGRIIAQVATGGGKSRIAKIVVARLNRPTLFLTTRSLLMHQMAKGFREMGMTPGMLGDGLWSPRSNGVSCGMVQTLVARLSDPDDSWDEFKTTEHLRLREETIRLLHGFEVVIGEEAHESSGGGYYDILQHCKNAYYRLALTATPFMKANEEANMKLMASFGPIGIKISEKLLIDRGILAKPIFKYVELPEISRPKHLARNTPWQSAYRLGITDHEFRNRAIVWEAARASEHGLSVLVLVQHKAHGKRLETMLREARLTARFIWGESEQEDRERQLGQLKDGTLQVLVASTILDVGVDVPALGMIILAGGGKAEVALRQRIGRGLREKKTGPNQALILDFCDGQNNHLKAHYLTRREIVEDTPGFAENILGKGVDFDFAPYKASTL